MTWIPVTTRLPDTCLNMLCWRECLPMKIGWYSMLSMQWISTYDGDYFQPSHWMELPAPPVGAKEGAE